MDVRTSYRAASGTIAVISAEKPKVGQIKSHRIAQEARTRTNPDRYADKLNADTNPDSTCPR